MSQKKLKEICEGVNMFSSSYLDSLLTRLQQLGTLLLTLFEALAQRVDDSGSLQMLFLSLTLQLLNLLLQLLANINLEARNQTRGAQKPY